MIPIVSAGSAILFCFFAAYLLDKTGTRFSLSFFTTLSISGLSLFAYSTQDADEPSFGYFLFGRAMFSMGYIGQVMWFSTITSEWFHYREYGVVMVLLLIFGSFG